MANFSYTQSVVLDGSGNGVIRLAPQLAKSWTVRYLTMRCSSAVREALGYVYANYVGDAYLLDNTFTAASGDTTDTVYDVPDGHCLQIRWVGGDAGATATVTWRGEEY
jgi:hypothetical protein